MACFYFVPQKYSIPGGIPHGNGVTYFALSYEFCHHSWIPKQDSEQKRKGFADMSVTLAFS